MQYPYRPWRIISIAIICILILVLVSPFSGQARVAFGAGSQSHLGQAAEPDLAQAVMQAVNADQTLTRSDGLVWTIQDMSLSTDKTQAVALLALVDPATNQKQPTEPLKALAKLGSAVNAPAGTTQWSVSLPGQADFVSRLQSLPSELQDPSSASELAAVPSPGELATPSANQTETSSAPIGGYYLPWANGVTQALVQGAHHVTCDVPSDCYYAFDFAAKYSDPPKFPILAARGGTVYTFYDQCVDRPEDATQMGTCTNYIVLQDKSTTPTTYQIYLHLSQNTIPTNFQQIGAVVQQGDWIANADNTGASWGSHLHFMVVTTIYNVGYKPPSYPWGASVDITFKDVSINWDAATQGGRPCGTSDIGYGKCTQSQYYYVSGNSVINPPTGKLVIPGSFQTVTDSDLLVGGWGTDDLGVTRMSMIANYNGAWVEVGPAQTVTPFAFDLNLCQTGIPDGPFDLALNVWDKAGNQSGPIDVRHLIKNVSACPNIPPPQPPVQTCSSPSSTQVVLFAGMNFTGACVTLGIGSYPNAAALAPLPDKSVSSIMVGSAVKAILYQGADFGPRRETFTGSDRSLADNRIGNDTVTGVIVSATTSPPQYPFLFPVYGPAGAAPTAADSLVLTWGWGDGGTSYQAALYAGTWTNSICTGTTPPIRTLSWQYGLTWSIGNLPAGNYTWCGQSGFPNPNGSPYTIGWNVSNFTVGAGSLPTGASVALPYSDTMENGANGWTATGLWRQAADPANQANQVWTFNNSNGVDYNAAYPANGDLTSPPIVLPTSGTQYLRFNYNYQTESSTPYWDQRWVQISTDGGASFQNLIQLSDDEMAIWLQSPFISLADYAGQTIRLRFHFDAIDTLNNSNLYGWLIDSVTVNSTGPESCGSTASNDTPATATAASYGSVISGSICPPGDVDYYKFSATRGDVLVAEVDAQSLTPASPLDSMLTLYLDPSIPLTVVAENDDALTKDPLLRYVIPQTGIYYLRVKAQNGPGVGGPGYLYTLKINKETDTTEPTVTLTYPVAGTGMGLSGTTPLLTATATDNLGGSGISHVDFYWHSSDWTSSAWTLIGSDSNGADGWQVPFDTSALPEGTILSIYAVAVDRAGNPGYSASWNVTIDRTPPTLSLQSLPDTNPDTPISLVWTASDAFSGVGHFNLQYNPDNTGWQDYPTPLPGSARQFWFVGAFGHQYAFRMTATDLAGNTSATSSVSSTTVAASCQPDSYEGAPGDNSFATAQPLVIGTGQTHNFCSTGDLDWVTFSLEKGVKYLILALPTTGSAAAPVVSVYTTGSQSINTIQQVSPAGLGQGTIIHWTAPASGLYALQSRSLDPAAAGSGVTYILEVAVEKDVYLPQVNSSNP